MPISFKKDTAYLRGDCPIEDAERLLSALIKSPERTIDLSDLESVHTAVVQVLMACEPKCVAAPEDEELSSVLGPILKMVDPNEVVVGAD